MTITPFSTLKHSTATRSHTPSHQTKRPHINEPKTTPTCTNHHQGKIEHNEEAYSQNDGRFLLLDVSTDARLDLLPFLHSCIPASTVRDETNAERPLAQFCRFRSLPISSDVFLSVSLRPSFIYGLLTSVLSPCSARCLSRHHLQARLSATKPLIFGSGNTSTHLPRHDCRVFSCSGASHETSLYGKLTFNLSVTRQLSLSYPSVVRGSYPSVLKGKLGI